MNFPEIESPKLDLSRNPGRQPLLVDMERFFEFSFWIAEELTDLVASHQHEYPETRQPLQPTISRLVDSDWQE